MFSIESTECVLYRRVEGHHISVALATIILKGGGWKGGRRGWGRRDGGVGGERERDRERERERKFTTHAWPRLPSFCLYASVLGLFGLYTRSLLPLY